MTAAVVEQVTAPSRRVTSNEVDADPAVERLRSVAGGRRPTLTVVRAAASDLRRVDVWLRGDEVALVPFREDPDAPVPCGVGSGCAGRLLLFEILADPAPVSGVGDIRRFADVTQLVSDVTSGVRDGERATVLHSHADGVDLVRLVGNGVVWGVVPVGEALELSLHGEAAYWAAVLRALDARAAA